MSLFRFCFSLFTISLCLTPVALAQVPDPVVTAQAPIPGSGHHYIGTGGESVNPVDGSLSFDLPLQAPAGRQLSFPFGIRYTGSEEMYLQTANSPSAFWAKSPAPPYQVNGWAYILPVYTAQGFTKSSSLIPISSVTTSIAWPVRITYFTASTALGATSL